MITTKFNTKKSNRCPYCVNFALCENDKCKPCYERSFAFHASSKNWDYERNGDIVPRQVPLKGGINYWLKCSVCQNSYQTTLQKGGSRCPDCFYYKSERLVSDFLSEIGLNFIPQMKFAWSGKSSFDFYLPETQILIEVDGAQHFRQIKNWTSPQIQQERDVKKMQLAIENGFMVVRICEGDMHKASFDWRKMLEDVLYNETPVALLAFLSDDAQLYDNLKSHFSDDVIA